MTRVTPAPGTVEWKRGTTEFLRGCVFCRHNIPAGEECWLGRGVQTYYAAHPDCLDREYGPADALAAAGGGEPPEDGEN